VKGISDDRWFGWLSLAIVAGYFIMGLWPFTFRPPNRVSWLVDRTGLHFETDGVAYDPASLPALGLSGAARQSANFTMELWVEANYEPANDVFYILTIHNRRLPFDFVLCQWQREFLLRATTQHPQPAGKIREVGVSGALPERKARFITVRGDGAGTDFYLDGLSAEHFPQFVLNAEALDGQLILGNDASGKHSWTGRLFGLAIYNQALDASEIAQHHVLWTQGHARQLVKAPGLTELYLFDEGGGQQAEDSSGHRHHVIIPAIYQVIHKEFLIPPWKDIAYDRPNYLDIVVNILGFVPFGFCFFLHCRLPRPNQWATNALFVVLAGAAVSLTIEVIQAWLPNRVSSMTDLLSNTAGTLLGVVLALAIRPKVTNAESALEVR
jgi:VanZ family protein